MLPPLSPALSLSPCAAAAPAGWRECGTRHPRPPLPETRARSDSQLTQPPRLGSIIQDPRNATLYTNRAMARLKLDMWDSVISDCRTCLELSPGNMKAYYYLSQARLAMGDHDEALADARRAYDLCVLAGDKSLQSVTTQVLRCKKERWETVEKRRVRQGNELEIVVKELMKKERDEAPARHRRRCRPEGDRRRVGTAASTRYRPSSTRPAPPTATRCGQCPTGPSTTLALASWSTPSL